VDIHNHKSTVSKSPYVEGNSSNGRRRALPKRAREAVVEKMLSDKEFTEDLLDTVIMEQRRKEPSRDLDEYLADRRKKGK
jgi:hypothetical protein